MIHHIDENDKVLLQKVSRGSKGDMDITVWYRVVKVEGVSLKAIYDGKREKPRK